jgi:CMP-N-acetylneuraminic acid synthetase
MLDITVIIPARGLSKRLPHKNLALLDGKPLIAHSIEVWRKSKYYRSPPIVSTDDDDIAATAQKYRAEVIIKRPVALSQDDTPTLPVIKHVIDYLLKYYETRTQWILILQPTSPLRSTADIDACIDMIKNNEADSVTSISDNSKHATGENGAIYITHADLVNRGMLYGHNLKKYHMPDERSIDIDTQEDLDKAEAILKGEKGNDNSGTLHKLGGHKRSQRSDKGRKRGGSKSK